MKQSTGNRIASNRNKPPVTPGAGPTAEAPSNVNPYSTGPTSNISDPISFTPSDLKSSEQLLDIPKPPVDTTNNAADGAFESLAQQNQAFISSLMKESSAAGASTGTAFESWLKEFSQGKDVETLTFEAENQAGLPALEQDLNRLNSELLSEQNSLKKRVDQINANTGGGLASGTAGEIANARRESYSLQSDIAIVQMAAQGRYDSASKWADRKAKIMFAAQERAINVREKIYTANKDYFDKVDSRAFQAKTDEMKRLLTIEREDEKTLQTTKLEALKMAQMNGAPVGVLQSIQSAKSPEEVLSVGGQWGSVDMLQRTVLREQLNSLRSKPEAMRQTQVIDQGGRKILVDTQSGEVLKDFGVLDASSDDLSMAVQQIKIENIDALKSHPGMYKAVGPTKLGRFTPFRADVMSGQVSDFTGSVKQMTEGLTLDKLKEAKANGTTFGSLTEGERGAVASAATKIAAWERKREDGSIYYEAPEGAFVKELDSISNYTKLDALNKGANPAAIGVTQMADGSLWSKNGDGSMTKLK